MFAFGRSSERIVSPFEKIAAALPMLAMCNVQVHPFGRMAEPPTSFDFVSARSGPGTVTESDGELFVSLLSTITFAGSTLAIPPGRGLVKLPGLAGVAVKTTSNAEGAASVTDPELTHARSDEPLIVQVIVPVTPT